MDVISTDELYRATFHRTEISPFIGSSRGIIDMDRISYKMGMDQDIVDGNGNFYFMGGQSTGGGPDACGP